MLNKAPSLSGKLVPLLMGLGMAALCTGVAWLCHSWGDLAFYLMVYLVGAVFVGWRWGRLAAASAALAGMLIHDLLFRTHRFDLGVEDWFRFLAALALVGVAHVVADLVQRLREQKALSEARERETAALYALSRKLAVQPSVQAILEAAGQSFAGQGPKVKLALEGDRGFLGQVELDQAEWERHPEAFREAALQQVRMALERALSVEEAVKARSEAELERTRHNLLSAVSHDFRTPLSAIKGAASSLVMDDLKGQEGRELLCLILDESKRLEHLMENLLDMTRLEHGELKLNRVLMPLDAVMGAVLERLPLGDRVQVELPDDLPVPRLDGALMDLLLTNLLENAFRHAQGLGVEVRAWVNLQGETAKELWIEVRDHGPGVPREDRVRIFDKFTRSADAKKDGGVGLGLAICKAIVKAHGGSIGVEEAPGGGAAFRVSIPLDVP